MVDSDLQGKRVLIADDEEYIRMHIAKGLRSRGLEVFEAGTGEEVLELVQNNPQVIIMDVQMPGLDGYSVAQKLKEKPETASIPLIMLSARAQDRDIEKGYAMGADYYLTKPVTFNQILGSLKEAVNG
ncbi:MAG: response regulator [Spirochaetales bacterium]|nr:response regulator [Spirochaetales bacterium]